MDNTSLILILLVEDREPVIDLVEKSLKNSEVNFELIIVNNLQEVFNEFSGDNFDVILFNWHLRDNKGLESFLELYEQFPLTPIITLTSDELIGRQSLEYGAEDYLLNDEFNDKILTSSIKKSITRKRAVNDLVAGEDVDQLTSPDKSKYFNVKLMKEYEQGLSEIIDFLPDAIFVIDKLGRILAWNKAIEELTGVEAGEMLGKGNYTYAIPFYGNRRPILIDMVLNYNKEIEKEYNYIKKDKNFLLAESNIILKGELRTIWIKAVPLYDKKYNVNGAIESVRDITESRKTEEEIKRALEEKNVLLKEIHHRVKNNLQIISSLLNLQKNYVKDKDAVNVILESKNRISSMAMVHEMLYQSRDIAYINITTYIKRLTTNLFYTYQKPNIPMPQINAENINLNIETSIPLGLIISELVSNSLKYAFPDDEVGEITVDLHDHDGEYELVISDTGIGFPKHLDYRNVEKSLGLKLVNSLVNQIDGSIEMDRSQGTKFVIKFQEIVSKKRI